MKGEAKELADLVDAAGTNLLRGLFHISTFEQMDGARCAVGAFKRTSAIVDGSGIDLLRGWQLGEGVALFACGAEFGLSGIIGLGEHEGIALADELLFVFC